MSNVIKPKRGSTVPTSSNLENGEIGINTSNQSLYYGTGDDVQQIKAENVTGVVGINHGGTGQTTRGAALGALVKASSSGGFTGDVDTLIECGTYWCDFSVATNGPVSSSHGNIEVTKPYNSVTLQRVTLFNTSKIYTRTFVNGSWQRWMEIFGTDSVVPLSSGGTGNTTRDLALTALSAGGNGETDANIVASGTYVLNTDTGSNLPPESGYYLLTVFRYHTSDLACGQIAINLSNGNLYSRDYVTGIWKDWVCCSSRKIDTILIPNGADLNNYRDKGFYASNRASNSIANLPSDLGSGAFELVVTGIDADGLYCTQWLKSYERNKIWIRTQFSSKEPWVWRDWQEVVMSGTINGLELGETLPSTAAHGGYIDFHYNGSTADYTSRLWESDSGTVQTKGNMDVTGWVQCSNGLWIAGGGLYASNNNSNIYGKTLPSAGTKGRIYFKKA